MMAASAIGDGTGGFSIEEVELADPGADEVLVEGARRGSATPIGTRSPGGRRWSWATRGPVWCVPLGRE